MAAEKLKRNPQGPQVDIPKGIAARGTTSDYVAYTAVHNKTEDKTHRSNVPCYSQHMATLSDHMFVCQPTGAKWTLPHDIYLKWMELCKANCLCPFSSEFLIEDVLKKKQVVGQTPIARIPGGNEGKHRIYTALCCYRYAESIAPLCYEAVKLSETRPELDFFQILHYCIGRYVAHVGHSFTHLCNSVYAMYGGGKNCRLDLVHSIGMKWWFAMDEEGKSDCSCKKGTTSPTNDALYAYCTALKFNVRVKDEVNALDPKYTPLYKVPKGDVAGIKALLK